MIDYNVNNNCCIYSELSEDLVNFWFDFKQKKFLHNIDTFYYSVKLINDFTDDSEDPSVVSLRIDLQKFKSKLNKKMGVDSVSFCLEGVRDLLLMRGVFREMYSIHLTSPEEFDLFIAPVVPHGASGDSVTPEIIVQLRSYFIWSYGITEAFERSFKYVESFCKKYGLDIAFVQENRVDFCWHTNYFLKPSSFFNPENFYKLRVSPFKDSYTHTFCVGSEGYEVDYLNLGKRGSKCFVRIYHKTKEVIEMGYKSFFFKIWLLNGLINRYDLFCYEEAFKKHNYNYLDIARLKWYLENGSDPDLLEQCKYNIDQYDLYNSVGDNVLDLADKCTPKLNTIINVEFQTMRKASKSFCLVPFHAKSNLEKYGCCSRIYDYLDNNAIICEYLTRSVLRLVSGDDKNKSRRPDCPFWAALRRSKLYDNKRFPDHVKLIREYNRSLNEEVARKKAFNNIVRLGFYQKGNNKDSVSLDIVDFINSLNDNDFKAAERYKFKQLLHLSSEFDEFESKTLNTGVSLFLPDGTIIDRSYADSLLNGSSIDEYFGEDNE